MIIEDDSFALGMPTPVQMLRQHARLVEAECEQLRHELDRARDNIEKLVAIHQAQAAEITKLNVRIERMTWELSDALVENTELKNRHIGGCPATWGAMPSKGYAQCSVRAGPPSDRSCRSNLRSAGGSLDAE
ncbi:hypothetical protein [Pseudomonas sp. DG56-2]|uniref:hypothetical protein n=1 Tax=Pseudomonas sp. DG56-2 TaxID=2320270 RepID=UPI0010A69582|nr:hypothetical protein [Pseudomonas sp. DG56-2]